MTNNLASALRSWEGALRLLLFLAFIVLLAAAAAGAASTQTHVWTGKARLVSNASQVASSNAQRRTEAKVKQQVIQRIDVGNTSSYTDSAGQVWSADTNLFMPERAVPESRGTPLIAGAVDPVIYHTYRGNVGGTTPQAERLLTFDIPVRGHRTVDLRLHFVELYWGAPGGGAAGPGKRIFDVEVNNRTVLKDFDITKASGGALRAVVVPIEDVEVTGDSLRIVFRPAKDFAAVSAIEILVDKQR